MEMKNYKSVPVLFITIWQLGQAVEDGGDFYYIDTKISIGSSGYLTAGALSQRDLSIALSEGKITTRQAIPWYEVEGVFPCLVRCNNTGEVYLVKSFKGHHVFSENSEYIHIDYCAPLSTDQAAKYGVEV